MQKTRVKSIKLTVFRFNVSLYIWCKFRLKSTKLTLFEANLIIFRICGEKNTSYLKQ